MFKSHLKNKKNTANLESRYVPRKNQFDRLILCFSDIEMGSGGVMDDFPHSGFFSDLLAQYNCTFFKNKKIDLIFNGDTFDLLKTDFEGKYPRHIDQTVAMGKFFKVASAHPKFFEGVRKFLAFDKDNRRVVFITGNHDFELFFPEVQNIIRSACGEDHEVLFPGLTFCEGKVKIEHGSQYDPMFTIAEEKIFLDYQGKKILNLPWGSVALLDVIMPLKEHLFHLDRLKPKNKVLESLPEFKDWLVSRMWGYYTQDFLRSDDPLKKISWTMLKEVVTRFYTLHVDVSIDLCMRQKLEESNEFSLYLIGHQHETGWWSFGNRKVIQTGCFRNEFMIEDSSEELSQIQKNYAEVFIKGDTVVRSHIVEVDSPPLPENYIPMGLDKYRDVIKNLLGLPQDIEKEKKAIQKLEEQETSNTKIPSEV